MNNLCRCLLIVLINRPKLNGGGGGGGEGISFTT